MTTRRLFSKRQRSALRLVAGNRCELCGGELTDSFHADHKHPFAKGGKTELSNGQALCPPCNLKKADKVNTVKKPDYSWQDKCVNAILESVTSGNRDFLVNATPGAGKTSMTIKLARRMLDADLINFMVVVVPTGTIRDRFVKDMEDEAGITLETIFDGETFRRIKAVGVGAKAKGFCLTTGMLMNNSEEIALLIEREGYKVLHVSDEAHHNGKGLEWGEAAINVSRDAVLRLGLSGTPFRTDDREIPFLHYDENGVGVPHFPFTFQDARDAGIITAISFRSAAGHVDVLDTEVSNDVRRYDFYDINIDNAGEDKRRLRYALDYRSPYLLKLVSAADDELQLVRKTQKDAAGIVFANTKTQAKRIAKYLTGLGRAVRLVIDNDNASESVKGFNASNEQWIVQIRKVYEGANIPRLRVGVYCTHYKTESFFVQCCGRLFRLVDGYEANETPALMFIPADKTIEAIASGMGEVKMHDLKAAKPSYDSSGSGNGADDPDDDGSHFEIVDGVSTLTSAIVEGQTYPPEHVEKVEAYFAKNPRMSGQPTAFKLIAYEDYKAMGIVS